MKLNFLGRGAAFNPKEGNNAAYFIENNQLFLIDCGESVFGEIIRHNILVDIECVNVFITHTHSDHIGSLGSLILYCFHNLNNKVNIIMKSKAKHKNSIDSILRCTGCKVDQYSYIFEENLDNKFISFNSVRYVETKHVADLDCYSLIFKTNDGILYYSGDTKELDILRSIIDSGEEIDKVFIDTSSKNFEDNPHVYIGDLKEIIPDNLKDKVYCMHLNDDDVIKDACGYGFKVVSRIE